MILKEDCVIELKMSNNTYAKIRSYTTLSTVALEKKSVNAF